MKKRKKRIACLITLCMVMSLFAGLPASATTAEGGETRLQGLNMTTDVERNDTGGYYTISEGAWFGTETRIEPKEEYVFYFGIAQTGSDIPAPVTDKDLLTVTTSNGDKISDALKGINGKAPDAKEPSTNAGFFTLCFDKCGEYTITYKDSVANIETSIKLNVALPPAGIYSTTTPSEETLFADNTYEFSEPNTLNSESPDFYMIINSDEAALDQDAGISIDAYGRGDNNITGEGVKEFIDYSYKETAGKNVIYEIWVLADESFYINVQMKDVSDKPANWYFDIHCDYKPKMKGLVIKDSFDWVDVDNGDGYEVISEGAEYFKDYWTTPKGEHLLYFEYVEPEGEARVPLTAEDLTVTTEDGEEYTKATIKDDTVDDIDRTGYVKVSFPECGIYKINYASGNEVSSIMVNVQLPEIGFYTKNERNEENYISGEYLCDLKNKSFYMIIDTDGELSEPVFKINDRDLNTDDEGVNLQGPGNYINATKVGSHIYKIDLLMLKDFEIQVNTDIGDGNINICEKQNGIISVGINWGEEEGEESTFPTADAASEGWKKEYRDLTGGHFAFKYVGNEGDEGELLGIDDIYVTYENETEPTDKVRITKANQSDDDSNWQEEILWFEFDKVGTYKVHKKGDSTFTPVKIYVELPSAGFYTSEKPTDEGYIREQWNYFKNNEELYLIYIPKREQKIEHVGFEINHLGEDGETSIEGDSQYSGAIATGEETSATDGSYHYYKITIDRDKLAKENFDIKAQFRESWESDETPSDNEVWLSLYYKTILDTSKIKWDYTKAFTYDGISKKVMLTGLPDGIEVEYTGNVATAVGKYKAKAVFSYDEELYETDISDMELDWEIKAPSTPDADAAPGGMENGSTTTIKPLPPEGEVMKDKDNKANYEVIKSDDGNVEVEYKAPANKKKATVTIPATVTLADGTVAEVTAIGNKAFKNNKKVKKVTIGKNVENIGKEAFAGATKLTTVKMGKKVETIGSNAFAKCTALKSVTLDKNVKKIGSKAFYGAKKLEKITIKSTKLTAAKVGKQAFKGTNAKAKVDVPKSKVKPYKKFFYKKGLSKKARIY